MSLNGNNADMEPDDRDSLPPTPPPVPDNLPPADNGLGPGPGAGPACPHLVVPGLVATSVQTAVFEAPPSYQPFGHQNLLQRAQAGQLRQDHLHLLQQALVSVQGVPPGFLAGAILPGGDTPQLPLFHHGMGLGIPVQGIGEGYRRANGSVLQSYE